MRSERDLLPVSGECWRKAYDRIRKHSRLVCTHEPKAVEIMMKHAANEYRKRTGHLPGELAGKVAQDDAADQLLAAQVAPPPMCVPFNSYDSTEPTCEPTVWRVPGSSSLDSLSDTGGFRIANVILFSPLSGLG